MEVDASIVVALITGGSAFAGAVVSGRGTLATVKQELADLRREVEKHNGVIERVYALEADQAANEERFKTLFSATKKKEDQ